MSAHKIKIVLLLALGIWPLAEGLSQQMFYSQALQNLYLSLPEGCRVDTTTTDTIVLYKDLVQGKTLPVIYRWDENDILEHIGYRFLQDVDTVVIDNAIIRLIERELLTVLTSSDLNQTLITYRENGFSILLNNTPVRQNYLQNKRQLLNLLENNRGITINFESPKYDVVLSCANGQKLSFHFKADSELITGMDKMERDVRLALQLKNHCAANERVVSSDYSYLQLLRDSLYVDKGSSFMIPQINSDLFYIKADSAYNLALDKSLIAESFANALLVPVKNDYKINITHRMYGKTVKEYTINSRDFDDYFHADYDRYFGVEAVGKDNLTGTLILNDRYAGSIHLAFVSISLRELLNGGTMTMQLYSNIPQHNIKTLFGK